MIHRLLSSKMLLLTVFSLVASSCYVLGEEADKCDRVRSNCAPCMYARNGGGFNCYFKFQSETTCPFGNPTKDCTNQIRANPQKILPDDQLTPSPSTKSPSENENNEANTSTGKSSDDETIVLGLGIKELAIYGGAALLALILFICCLRTMYRRKKKADEVYRDLMRTGTEQKTSYVGFANASDFGGPSEFGAPSEYGNPSSICESSLDFYYKDSEVKGSIVKSDRWESEIDVDSVISDDEESVTSSQADDEWNMSTISSIPDFKQEDSIYGSEYFSETMSESTSVSDVESSIELVTEGRASQMYGYHSTEGGDSIFSDISSLQISDGTESLGDRSTIESEGSVYSLVSDTSSVSIFSDISEYYSVAGSSDIGPSIIEGEGGDKEIAI